MLAKTFEYITPVMEITPSHLRTTNLLSSRSFHMLASPFELINVVSSLRKLRKSKGIRQDPLIVWEPRPSSCLPENKAAFLAALSMVDIISPNHIEIAKIFGCQTPEVYDRTALEEFASTCLDSGVGPRGLGAVVIRAGTEGCLVCSRAQQHKWLPAFFVLSEKSDDTILTQVVDPTGAGNTFLGAFTIGFLATRSLVEAAIYGSVGASFALEQHGLPRLGMSQAGVEVWNNEQVETRLLAYKSRLSN